MCWNLGWQEKWELFSQCAIKTIFTDHTFFNISAEKQLLPSWQYSLGETMKPQITYRSENYKKTMVVTMLYLLLSGAGIWRLGSSKHLLPGLCWCGECEWGEDWRSQWHLQGLRLPSWPPWGKLSSTCRARITLLVPPRGRHMTRARCDLPTTSGMLRSSGWSSLRPTPHRLPTYWPPLQNEFLSKCKMYLSQIEKCIFLKLQYIFVSNFKIYLSPIAKCICLKLQNVFVSNWKFYLSQFAKHIL